jgi:hypothetical protein
VIFLKKIVKMEYNVKFTEVKKERDSSIGNYLDFLRTYLQEAVKTLNGVKNDGDYSPNIKDKIANSWRWINSQDGSAILGFNEVCDALDFNDEAIREGIIRGIKRNGTLDKIKDLTRRF